jgi:hypothetical protein
MQTASPRIDIQMGLFRLYIHPLKGALHSVFYTLRIALSRSPHTLFLATKLFTAFSSQSLQKQPGQFHLPIEKWEN